MNQIQIDQIDLLSSKARQQAKKLNKTLDKLKVLGIEATIDKPITNLFGSFATTRVRLTLTQPIHKEKEENISPKQPTTKNQNLAKNKRLAS